MSLASVIVAGQVRDAADHWPRAAAQAPTRRRTSPSALRRRLDTPLVAVPGCDRASAATPGDGVLRGGRRGLRAWRSVIARRGAVARRVVARPFSVPRDRLDLVREVPPRRLDGGEEAAGEIVEEGQAEENIRLRDEGGGGRE